MGVIKLCETCKDEAGGYMVLEEVPWEDGDTFKCSYCGRADRFGIDVKKYKWRFRRKEDE